MQQGDFFDAAADHFARSLRAAKPLQCFNPGAMAKLQDGYVQTVARQFGSLPAKQRAAWLAVGYNRASRAPNTNY
jgi:hypothetical protein